MGSFELNSIISDQLKTLSKVSFWRQLSYFLFNWSFIVSVACLSEVRFRICSYAIAIFLIAARQHALAVLVHDGAHYRISKNKKINDFVSNFFGSYVCFLGTHAYRLHHLQHHQHLNTQKDPDWARKIHLKEWQFPMSARSLAGVLMRQFWIGGYEWLKLTSSMSVAYLKLGPRDQRFRESRMLILYWCTIIAISSYFHVLSLVALYWIVPMLTIFPLIQRFRSITEHFSVNQDKILSFTRNTQVSKIEGFLLSPHSVHWHLVHHLYPAVPHYHLGSAQKILSQDEKYREGQHLNLSYCLPSKRSVLKDLLRDQRRLETKPTEKVA